jgi:hypothetical protein
MKKAILLIVFPLILFYLYSPYQISYSQGLAPFSYIRIKITSPLNGESIPTGNSGNNAPTIYGTSIADSNYNTIHNCRVSIIVNGIGQYQPVISTGSGGLNDYSRWMYTLAPYSIREGMNTITAKLSCINPYSTSFSTINIMGTSGLYPRNTIASPPPGPTSASPQDTHVSQTHNQKNSGHGGGPQHTHVSQTHNQKSDGPIGPITALCSKCHGGGDHGGGKDTSGGGGKDTSGGGGKDTSGGGGKDTSGGGGKDTSGGGGS